MNKIAAGDQAEAKEREFERRVQKVAAWGLIVFAVLGLYSLLAVMGVLPAAPWSPLGQ